MATLLHDKQAEEDAALIADGRCPVCELKFGIKKPRKSLIMHFRRKCDVRHSLWKAQNYTKHFYASKHKDATPFTITGIEDLLRKHFGLNTKITLL
jgi:hypothetical protein